VALGCGCKPALQRWCVPVTPAQTASASASARAPAGLGGKLYMALQHFRRLDGSPHTQLIDAFHDAIAWHVLTKPGVSEEALRAHFSLVSPLELRTILRLLVTEGTLEELQVAPPPAHWSPFASTPRAGGERGVAVRRAYVCARHAREPFICIREKSAVTAAAPSE
jgi:hypothetical protein